MTGAGVAITRARDPRVVRAAESVGSHARVEDIQKTALTEGMLTLKQDGIEKALQGKTDLAQVRAVAI